MDINKGKPLTVEELKSLKIGDWVWVITEKDKRASYWEIDENDYEYIILICGDCIERFDYSDHGISWLAYKNKEEAENAGYGDVKQYKKELEESEKLLSKQWWIVCERKKQAVEEFAEKLRNDKRLSIPTQILIGGLMDTIIEELYGEASNES